MKTADIVALLKDGKKPMVKLTACLWDDSWGQKGMVARITGFVEHQGETVELAFDYNEHKEHNLSLQEHNWYLPGDNAGSGQRQIGTKFEAGGMDANNVFEEVHFDDPGDVPVELADGSPILAEYLRSGSTLSYVEWLEMQLEELVPDAMKPWSDEI